VSLASLRADYVKITDEAAALSVSPPGTGGLTLTTQLKAHKGERYQMHGKWDNGRWTGLAG